MKKLLALLLCVVLSVSLVACAGESGPTKEYAKGENATQEAEDAVFGLNETAVFDNLKFTALEMKESTGENYFTPETGNVFVGVKFEIENTSDEEQTVSTLLLFEGYVDDVKCEYSVSAACAFDDGTLDGTLAPGKKLVGWYSLEVPKDWKTIELDVQASLLSGSSAKFVFEK